MVVSRLMSHALDDAIRGRILKAESHPGYQIDGPLVLDDGCCVAAGRFQRQTMFGSEQTLNFLAG